MSDFRTLKAPAPCSKGWYIPTKKPFGWLTTTGVISSDTDNMAILHYESEFAAHNAAILYYNDHGKIYNGGDEDGAIVVDESQVMEFV